jgi:hypothetical protein
MGPGPCRAETNDVFWEWIPMVTTPKLEQAWWIGLVTPVDKY